MLSILVNLEPRRYEEKSVVLDYEEYCYETTFIMSGTYLVGFLKNTKRKFIMQVVGDAIGGFNCLHTVKSKFIY